MADQDNSKHLITISIPKCSGKNYFATEFIGDELISSCFQYEFILVTEARLNQLQHLFATSALITLQADTHHTQLFHGVITDIAQIKSEYLHTFQYKIKLEPWFALLKLNSNCQTYYQKSIPELIKIIFAKYSFAEYELNLAKSYPSLDAVAQFNESDHDFICRLLAEAGIYFYFTHQKNKHVLTISDNPETPFIYSEPLSIYQNNPQYDAHLSSWTEINNAFNTDLAARLYNIDNPFSPFSSTDSIAYNQHFTFPSDSYLRDNVQLKNTLLQQQQVLQRENNLIHAESNYSGLKPNQSVQYQTGDSYKIISIHHQAKDLTRHTHFSSQDENQKAHYQNTFIAMKSGIAYKPQQKAKPLIAGLQSADVVSPDKKAIYSNDYGSVKIKRHWDMFDHSDVNQMPWTRVRQIWAGKDHGTQFIPRPQQTAMLSYLNGDIDQPIILGGIYHQDYLPPYNPHHQNGFKTQSLGDKTKGHQLILDDKANEEKIYLHSARDMNVMINHDQKAKIKHNRKLTIKKGQLKESVTKKYQHDSLTEIRIQSGQSTITITPQMIKVQSKKITLDTLSVSSTASGNQNSVLTSASHTNIDTLVDLLKD